MIQLIDPQTGQPRPLRAEDVMHYDLKRRVIWFTAPEGGLRVRYTVALALREDLNYQLSSPMDYPAIEELAKLFAAVSGLKISEVGHSYFRFGEVGR